MSCRHTTFTGSRAVLRGSNALGGPTPRMPTPDFAWPAEDLRSILTFSRTATYWSDQIRSELLGTAKTPAACAPIRAKRRLIDMVAKALVEPASRARLSTEHAVSALSLRYWTMIRHAVSRGRHVRSCKRLLWRAQPETKKVETRQRRIQKASNVLPRPFTHI